MSFKEDQKRLLKLLKKHSKFKKTMMPVVETVALKSNARLKQTTQPKPNQKKTQLKRPYKGSTRQAWGAPEKIRDGYENSNISKTDDKKHLIVNLINYGRKEVRPIHAKMLYIPLTGKGRKEYRKPIPNDAKFGKDYILAKRSQAWKGTKFVDKEVKKASEEMVRLSLEKIEKDLSS